MTQEDQIEIPLSKTKMVLTLIGAIVFVGIGFWFLINPPKINIPVLGNPISIFITGLALLLFFGLAAVLAFRKLSDKKAGLIINREGIIDNSSGVSSGLVLWTDIEKIEVRKVMNQKFLMFMIKNPEDYIRRVTNPLKRKGIEINYKRYGSPIFISANSLQTNFENLYTLVTEKMKEYKS